MFPAHITAAYTNVKKRLYPLFEDATTYLMKEPNKTILLNSINQYESGKAREVSFLDAFAKDWNSKEDEIWDKI